MKNFTTLLLFLYFSVLGFSQTYTGKIVDREKEPIAYANILAFRINDEKLISGVITNDDGGFELKITEEKPFYLEISFIGFETQKIKPTKTSLGTIMLKEKHKNLEEIVITARKKIIEQKVDRLAFNVENSIVSSGGSVLDVLKATPSVQVSNNRVSIVGKSSVKVLINGRIVQLSNEELTNYLEGIASNDIKNIEVITTPPSKYEAEGNGGLINIVLKKPKKNSWSNQIRATYDQMTFPTFKVSNTFNYSYKKWQILVGLHGQKGNQQQKTAMLLKYPNQTWKDTIVAVAPRDYISAKFGVDYKISPNSNVGLFYMGRKKNIDTKQNSTTFISNIQSEQIGDIKNNGFENQKLENNSLNIHYLQKIDTLGKSMSVDLDYFNYRNYKSREFTSERTGNKTVFQEINNTGSQNITNYSAKIDFIHPNKFANFSYGGKITQTKTDNKIEFYDLTNGKSVFDTQKSNVFEYTENIQALYIDMMRTLSPKWQIKLGLRSEFTQTKGFSKNINQTNTKNYVKLFPTVYVSYVKNQNNIFNISYSRRIERPNFYRLNPFKFYINANSYVEGNPSLQPDFSHNIEFKYIYKKRYTTKLFYTSVEGISHQVPKIDVNNNIQYYTFENIGNQKAYGVIETILYNPFKWWNITNMIAGFYQGAKINQNINLGTNKTFNGWQFQVYSNHSFLLNTEGTIQAEATFYANSKNPKFIYNVEPMWFLNLGLKMQFLDRKLQVIAKINDVFRTSNPNSTTYTNGIKQVYNSYSDNRYFSLGLSYKFGNKRISVKQRDKGNREEMNRVY